MLRRLGLLLVLCALAASSAGAQTMSLVRDLNTGINLFGNSYPEQLLAAGGKVFFVADWNGAAGVWVSDGTPAGTVLLREQPTVLLGNLGRTVLWISAGPDADGNCRPGRIRERDPDRLGKDGFLQGASLVRRLP
jgi:hypothetical protein